jgi:uncharacterized protein YbjQ (UPF0145 family)
VTPGAKISSKADTAASARSSAWEQALSVGRLPDFVEARLADAGAGRTPWLATMTAAELLVSRSHGVRPLATVSGTCWFQYGRSWTEGHASGWRTALERIRQEALACGANAVVDVRMKTASAGVLAASMDYTLIGTAVSIDGLPPSSDPVIATVPALEFVRLLEMGIVPAGLAVGAHYEWLFDYNKSFGGSFTWNNQPLGTLGNFWEHVRRAAHASLREDTARQGAGVLAHTQFSQLFKQEVDKQPDRYLGRYIVMGTVVETRRGDGVPHHIQTVVDMRDDVSPLRRLPRSDGYSGFNEREGPI